MRGIINYFELPDLEHFIIFYDINILNNAISKMSMFSRNDGAMIFDTNNGVLSVPNTMDLYKVWPAKIINSVILIYTITTRVCM